MISLVDLDLIVYKVGSITDGRHYKYGGERYGTQKELFRACKTLGHEPPKELKLELDPLPWEEASRVCVSYLEDILENFDDYKGYLTGKGNFRYQVATILPYKGNRVGVQKPHHYDSIRQFLVDIYDAEVSSGLEADDLLGLNQTDNTCIVSTDKDLDVVPGWHYNWDKGDMYKMNELDSDRCFFKQLLTGDSTDNILGLFNVGVKSTYVKAIDKMTEVSEMYNHVRGQYESRFGSYWEVFLKETAQLLWIQQVRPCPVGL